MQKLIKEVHMTRKTRNAIFGIGTIAAALVLMGTGCPWLSGGEADSETKPIQQIPVDQTATDNQAAEGQMENINDTDQDPEEVMESDTTESVESGSEDAGVGGNDEGGLFEPGAEPEAAASETVSQEAGLYTDYSPERLESLTGRTIIFFHAGWCPTCRALESDILAHLSDIPSDVTILKADYDTELDLRKEYRVNVQSTLVQIDESGNAVTTISGVTRLESVLSQLK